MYPDIFFACRSDDECAVIWQCADIAVSKKYLDQFKPIACAASLPHDPDASAKCIDHKCAVRLPDPQK
jgi:hypothetical protein